MGTNFFPSRTHCCPQCLKRQITVGEKKITEYYHRVVVCQLIGYQIPVILDAEPMLPGEGEVIAARRLLQRVFHKYNRLIDVIVGDAIYLESPFFNLCIDHNKDVIAVLKSNNRGLLEDATGIFSQMEPGNMLIGKRNIQCWDVEGFDHCTIEKPLRVVHTIETETKMKYIGGKRTETQQRSSWYWASTLTKKQLPSNLFIQPGHWRWDIENKVFNSLVNHWSLNHCFRHEPSAIINFILTLFIAYMLIQCFYHRNLKPQCKRIFNTVISLAREFHGCLCAGKSKKVPWQRKQSHPPP